MATAEAPASAAAAPAADSAITDFATYEDFLDSQISPVDLYYLEVGRSAGLPDRGCGGCCGEFC